MAPGRGGGKEGGRERRQRHEKGNTWPSCTGRKRDGKGRKEGREEGREGGREEGREGGAVTGDKENAEPGRPGSHDGGKELARGGEGKGKRVAREFSQ
jgi:hypothetical protein